MRLMQRLSLTLYFSESKLTINFHCDSDFLKVTRTLKNYCRIKIIIRKLLIKKKDKIFNSGKGEMKCFGLMTF